MPAQKYSLQAMCGLEPSNIMAHQEIYLRNLLYITSFPSFKHILNFSFDE